jgi:hypothetical protein
MSASIPLQLAETVQTAHINRQPSPQHDVNPSTAASKKEPVRVVEPGVPDDGGIDDHLTSPSDVEDEIEDLEEEDDEDFPSRAIKPRPRRHHLPPMPDLRFEQSYLWSIRNADTWWKVAWITVRDQVRGIGKDGSRGRSEEG